MDQEKKSGRAHTMGITSHPNPFRGKHSSSTSTIQHTQTDLLKMENNLKYHLFPGGYFWLLFLTQQLL